ncbi:AraC family transcriptional regulator [Streptomyces sp. MMG1533]|uniref:AraC-like ligand-binding domain-containing protein n=1 Tax=Streptomyces sp. MMG1533 TaxID=1415546 RepID=UPI0006AEB450|nr:helix-turn-helix domain-containing protein [Streptomyces sp. MMG1533]KOU77708.1 AraC family transcriptional regulator [Streptomyces sp. MMG1533]
MSISKETSGQGAAAAGPVVRMDAGSVPASDRFGWWAEVVHEIMPVSIRSAHATRFQGELAAVGLPHSQVMTFTFSPMTARRSLVQIRRQDPEDYFLILVRGGSSIRLEQAGGVACLGAGDMTLYSSSHPLACEFHDHGRQCRMTVLRLPRTVLPLAGGRADRLLAEPLRAGTGSAALLGPYLTGLPEAALTSGPAELARLGSIGVDLAASLLAARLGDQDALPVETRKAALRARINAFIDHHLADPELRPAAIAAHHHISVRTLHLLFRSEPEPVAATIRRRRLERCHADLTDPGLRHRTIGETAARWGFRHPADFSRAFRGAYGVSPSDVRARALDMPVRRM